MSDHSLMQWALPSIPISIAFPPLPTIQDNALERQVFTHTSYHHLKRNPTSFDVDSTQRTGQDNEKLEHIGDALLGSVVTVLLHERYPMLEEGPATMLKARLVQDSFLAQISRRYGLPARMIAQPSQKPTLVDQEKPVANLFEAYVAGLYMSLLGPNDPYAKDTASTQLGSFDVNMETDEAPPAPGRRTHGQALDLLEQWLHPLFTPLADWAIVELREAMKQIGESKASMGVDEADDEKAIGAMARLNQHFIAKEDMKPVYESVEGPSPGQWTTQCKVMKKDGTMYTAKATRTTKKAASTFAAWLVAQQMGWT